MPPTGVDTENQRIFGAFLTNSYYYLSNSLKTPLAFIRPPPLYNIVVPLGVFPWQLVLLFYYTSSTQVHVDVLRPKMWRGSFLSKTQVKMLNSQVCSRKLTSVSVICFAGKNHYQHPTTPITSPWETRTEILWHSIPGERKVIILRIVGGKESLQKT